MSTFRVEEIVPIRGRGLLLCGTVDADPSTAVGATLTAPDGRSYVIRGVERQGMKRWQPGDPSGVLVAAPGPEAGEVLTFEGVAAAPAEPEGPRVYGAVRVFIDGRELVERPIEEEPRR